MSDHVERLLSCQLADDREEHSRPSALQPPAMPTSDSNLINGKMNYNCSAAPKGSKCMPNAGVSQFRSKSGKVYRLRVINRSADATQRFSIDGHNMTVIANDFVAVEPYTTNVVTLGQRTDVIVQSIGESKSSYWMRSNPTCAKATQPNSLAVIYYDDADTMRCQRANPDLPSGTCQRSSEQDCSNVSHCSR
jgi:FtsP/CotA-like multicopper oxidase with cupredoxin domain